MRRMLLLLVTCTAVSCGRPSVTPVVPAGPEAKGADGSATADYWQKAAEVLKPVGPVLAHLDGRDKPFTGEDAGVLKRAVVELRTLPTAGVDEQAVACAREAAEVLLDAERYAVDFQPRPVRGDPKAWLAKKNEQRSRKVLLLRKSEAWAKQASEAREQLEQRYQKSFADLISILKPPGSAPTEREEG